MAIIRDVSVSEPIDQSPKAESYESEKNISAPVGIELQEKAIADVMGIEKNSDIGKYSEKLNTLLDYAKSQTKDHSPESLKWVIRSLELKLGTPPFAEDRINFIARYAYLLMDEKKINEEKKKFERL